MKIIPLHWDSDFFGIRIAKAIIASENDIITLSCQEENLRHSFDLIYIFSEPGLEIPIEKAKLVDKKADFSINSLEQFDANSAIVRWESPMASEALISLALVSGQYSRFKLDKCFPIGSYERLYTRWIQQSVNKAIATDVFCYMIDGIPRGLVTLDFHEGQGIIGLVAVDEDFQHNGIGTALIEHTVSYVHNLKGERLRVATQMDNEPACRLYSKCGFSLESITKIWHWWL